MAKQKEPVFVENFTPLGGIAAKVFLVLYVSIGADVATAFVTAISGMLAERARGNSADLAYGLSLLVVLIMALVQIVVTITCAVLFCKWMYRAYRNLFWFRMEGLHGTPRAAVWSWFIPFLNLVMPYRYMRELWLASDPRAAKNEWNTNKVPAEFRFWWACWLLQAFAAQFAARLEMQAGDGGSRIADVLDIGADISSILAAVLVIRIVKEITERQEHKSHAITTKE